MMARKRSKVLSERQKKILEVLEKFQINTHYPPTIREICDQANISSTSVVNYYLDQLQEMGYIERDGRVSRGIRLLRPLSEIGAADEVMVGSTAVNTLVQGAQKLIRAVDEMLQVPLVGQIIAGKPIPIPQSDFSYFDPESMVEVASSMLPGRDRNKKDLFALRVKGDSMIDAMVNEGDIVIMKPAVEASNGEMVAVWLDDREETTLKYFYLESERVRLQPANPTMKPIYVDPATVRIQGKVVMVIRQVEGSPL
jgi:repressor LexA